MPSPTIAGLGLDDHGAPIEPTVIIRGDDPATRSGEFLERLHHTLSVIIVVAEQHAVPPSLARAADVVLASEAVESGEVGVGVADPGAEAVRLAAAVASSPAAALSLAWLLRASPFRSVADGLALESATYSTLLAGSVFRNWLAARGDPRPGDGPDRIRLDRDGDLLRITLARPARRNAVDRHMRHALVEALGIAALDPTIRVEIDADGPSFSAGGDLDEFGTATDLAAAHLIRVAASPGPLIHDLRERVTVRVHGACVGAGIELPAFAGRIVAHPASRFGLPEVGMGLIPGAGGTVSIPARIGRSRTFWLAVGGRDIDAATALGWGLVDELG